MGALLTDLTLLGVFLLVGFIVRELIPPLQKLFLPASIIGGVVLLILGPQVLNVVKIPDSFSGYSGALIRLVMCATIFGTNIDRKKLVSYGDYISMTYSVYGMQMAVGLGLGAVCCIVWKTLPKGWGFLAGQAFYGGHGTTAAAGSVFNEVTGLQDYNDIGMVMATFGLIIAMTVGMVIVNIGVRKGWTSFVKEVSKQPKSFYCGILPQDQQVSIGTQKTTSISISPLALQLGFILASMYIGEAIGKGLKLLLPVLSGVSLLGWDIIGGVVGWYLIKLFRLEKYTDKKSVSSISGMSLEILILSAVATLNLKVLFDNIVPILIMTIVICGLTIAWCLFITRKSCKDEWFEKAIMTIGMATGAAPTGMALVRAIDPDGKSTVPEALGIYTGITFWTAFFTSMLPPLVAKGNNATAYIIGIASFVVCFALNWFVFRPMKQKAEIN